MSGELDPVLAWRVIPVVTLSDPDFAIGVAAALVRGGLPVAEVTFRSDAAEQAIATIASQSGVRVGAGTVVNPELVDRAVAAGATFIITPGFSAPVIERCLEIGIPVIPGIGGATDIMDALTYGLTVMKLFPADALGGPPMVKALSAPFPKVRFVPTGGVTAAVAGQYLAIDSVAAVGGSWITPSAAITSRRFEEVERLAAEAVAICAANES
ncbi:MAG TPA: bifunctional 4-hydroxy-2-oxoglutarate aldolase/2-dehydro-3-deoxy-phosphogluconate aldolase [Gaiellaceae bacterium]|nr:bifunctional 4-hydroxy-2-oxoglutarate aldolase/2-dehydro-3-deoxy-phosphogluconate aldolase [Gaiellaceae bacterium]